MMKIKVIFHKAEEGSYWAEVPALAGCFSQVETIEETKINIREAIKGFLEIEDKSIEISLINESIN
jgi:predicted RNase H-like HicB family nuclease